MAFLDRHAVEGVPVVADLFHIQLEREPFAVLHEHADRIGHAHIADTGRRYLGSGDWRGASSWASSARSATTARCPWSACGDDFGGEVRSSLEALRAL